MTLQIKVLLNKELAKKFREIKEEYGLETTTETIRFCINMEHKRLFRNNKPKQN